jgi:lipoate-protein ligase A
VTWRLLLTPPLSGAENMALDEALMERARDTGEAVLRIYTWSVPTLSFGRNQTTRGRYDPERIARRGIALVRRPTGGRTILHHREVTYSVTAPAEALGSLRESYARINRLLVYGLSRLGVDARVVAGTGRAPRPTEAPCFDQPVAGELSVDGRKLAGSAQWRDGGALLQHGSILVADDQTAVAELLVGEATPPPPPATLSEAMGRTPDPDEVAQVMFEAVQRIEDAAASSLELDATLSGMVHTTRSKYVDDAWTWRR